LKLFKVEDNLLILNVYHSNQDINIDSMNINIASRKHETINKNINN